MKTRILVTGANGYIGSALVHTLIGRQKEFHVAACARRGSILQSKLLKVFLVGNQEDNQDLSEPLRDVDVVIHCAAMSRNKGPTGWSSSSAYRRVNTVGTFHWAWEAARAGVKRFVYVSTSAVNGESTKKGEKFHADSLPRPKTAFSISMWEAERELKYISRETGMQIVVVRVPMVYGPGCGGLFGEVTNMIRFCLPLPLRSCKNNKLSLVGIDNLVDFLICVATHPAAAGHTFMVSDGKPLSALEIFKKLSKSGNRPLLFWPMPVTILKFLNDYLGRSAWGEFFFDSQVIDISKNKRLLGWFPPNTVEQSFSRVWERNGESYSK